MMDLYKEKPVWFFLGVGVAQNPKPRGQVE